MSDMYPLSITNSKGAIMRGKSLVKAMAGFGCGAAMLLGCQNTVSQKSDATTVSETNAALLQLAVKDSSACVDLQSRCRHAHENGNDSQTLVTDLVDSCILDTAAAHRILGERHGSVGDRDDDSDGVKQDSAAAKAFCDSLTTVLAAADTAGAGYASIKHRTAEACEERTWGMPDGFGMDGSRRRNRGHHGWD